MRKLISISMVGLTAIVATQAWAYGTVRSNPLVDSDLEHERITRRAFSCKIANPIADCFEKKTLNKMAGKTGFFGTFGGVGYPDKLVNTKIKDTQVLSEYEFLAPDERPVLNQKLPDVLVAHCDNADHVEQVEGYPRSKAQSIALIKGCRLWMNDHFLAAVDVAAGMVNDGKIVKSQVKRKSNCITWKQAGSTAKCNTLTHFGIMLHASQDFYSHSNWNDKPMTGDLSSSNPPGLGNSGPAPFLRMPIASEEIPTGLMTGCWEGFPKNSNCVFQVLGGPSQWRATHGDINKDHGVVDPKSAAETTTVYTDVGALGRGKSKRGMHDENFERSVQAAILDTRSKLADFKTALELKYGSDDAKLMFCAFIKDNPVRDCI